MIDKIGGRKVLIGIFLVFVGVAIEILTPKGLTDTMSTYLLGMGLGYFLANGVVHATDAVKQAVAAKKAAKAPAQPQAPDLTPVITALSKQQEELKAAIQGLGTGGDNQALTEVQLALKGVVNQNAVLAQTLNSVAQGTSYLVQAVQGSAGQQK